MGESLHVCVYERCGKSFAAPVRLTDLSHKPRSATYYACPYCFSKMDESEPDASNVLKLVKSPKAGVQNETPTVDCPHHVGYLKTRSKDQAVPDSCLTCPKILQCMV